MMTKEARATYLKICPVFGVDDAGNVGWDEALPECRNCKTEDGNFYAACVAEAKIAATIVEPEVDSIPEVSEAAVEALPDTSEPTLAPATEVKQAKRNVDPKRSVPVILAEILRDGQSYSINDLRDLMAERANVKTTDTRFRAILLFGTTLGILQTNEAGEIRLVL